MQRLILDTLAFCLCIAVMYSVSLTSSGRVNLTGGLFITVGDSLASILSGVRMTFLLVSTLKECSGDFIILCELSGCAVLELGVCDDCVSSVLLTVVLIRLRGLSGSYRNCGVIVECVTAVLSFEFPWEFVVVCK